MMILRVDHGHRGLLMLMLRVNHGHRGLLMVRRSMHKEVVS